jgi:hypothetical protein
MARYGQGAEAALENVTLGMAKHDSLKLGDFVVVSPDDPERVLGKASIYPSLSLRELRLPIPPGFARGPLAIRYPYAAPNIQAWVKGGSEGLLSRVYQELSEIAERDEYKPATETEEGSFSPRNATWTIEAQTSPSYVHDAILSVDGLQRVAARRFDDQEHHFRRVPPVSTLYANLQSPEIWAGDKKLDELRLGRPWVGDTAYDLS